MDFILSLLTVRELVSILVVVDQFLKSAEEVTKLVMKNVVKYWGVLHNIINDRDVRFLGWI